MIKVFKANDTNFTSNGEITIKPIEAIITKNSEEEYLELEGPLKYADFLVQDNILIVDTIIGKKGYKIHNPIIDTTIVVKAWLCYQEKVILAADRGAVISQGKNLASCKITENWDAVVTRLTPVGYNDTTLPEGSLSVTSPYQKDYTKTIEFELSEELEDEVEALEETIDTNKSLEASLKNSVTTLQAKYNSYDGAITSLQAEKTTLQQRLSQLGNTEPELKEKAIIEAQIPLIDDEIDQLTTDKANTLTVLDATKLDLTKAQTDLKAAETQYNDIVITDLRSQAQSYLNINQYPQINYDLEAHLNGVIEIGDIVKVKHPDMRVDLLTNVSAYQFDCLTMKFRQVVFGTLKTSLKGKFSEVDRKIEKVSDDTSKLNNAITKYSSEYKRDNEELVSKFVSELYGLNNGIYGAIQKNASMFRQTASEISGTVTRVNADLSTQIASVRITADEIRSEVEQTTITLNGKIDSNTTLISQTATQIRSEVNAKFTNYSTTTQMNSAINQSANSITSSVSTQINGLETEISTVEQTANKVEWLIKSGTSSTNFLLTDRAISLVANTIDLSGYVTFTNLSQVNTSTVINGGNITTGSIDATKVIVKNINASNISTGTLNASYVSIINLSANSITTGTLSADRIYGGILDASRMTVKNLSADSITTGYMDISRMQAGGQYTVFYANSNSLSIGGTSYSYINTINLNATNNIFNGTTTNVKSTYCTFGASGGYIGFFGTSSTSKKSVSQVSTSATSSTIATKLNELLNALEAYGLITSY